MRTSWLDDKTDLPIIDDKVHELEHFTDALADGMIDKDELSGQEERLVDALKAAEAVLGDDAHALVTTAMVELTAYNVMATLAEIQRARLQQAFG